MVSCKYKMSSAATSGSFDDDIEEKETATKSVEDNENQEDEDTRPANEAADTMVPHPKRTRIILRITPAVKDLQQAGASATTDTVASTLSGTTKPTPKKRKAGSKVSQPKRARLEDNPEYDLSKIPKVGTPSPEMLRFKLKLTDGTYTEPYRFKLRHIPKWDDKAWVAALHKWRKRILDRVIIKEADPNKNPDKKISNRSKWSWAELESLRMEIRKLVKSTGVSLSTKDWKKLNDIHMAKFANTEIRVGERLAYGGVATTTQTIDVRTISAMKCIYDKFPDMKAIVKEEIEAWRSESDEDPKKTDDFAGVEDSLDSLDDVSSSEDEGRPQFARGNLVKSTS
ncbi:hypothetical protein VTL71DRAFT_4500 [Oculimacula yallundae]|uniref:Uncharacterized protein n=1 Tax=Oculimacula yallundae TaxID=86028 RepID=A0ABR4C3R3_9HELO